ISTNTPFEDICSDVLGPFILANNNASDSSKQMFIFTFTDRCTRKTTIQFISVISAKALIKAFKRQWLDNFPKPKTFLSDNGKCYRAKAMRLFME
ncbi:MAG: integrase catalytic domain-containing protein, partial [Culicoidibacterales bacterium]